MHAALLLTVSRLFVSIKMSYSLNGLNSFTISVSSENVRQVIGWPAAESYLQIQLCDV